MQIVVQWILLVLFFYLLIKLAPFLLALGGIVLLLLLSGGLMLMWRIRQARRQFEQAQSAFIKYQTANLRDEGSGPIIHVQAEVLPSDEDNRRKGHA